MQQVHDLAECGAEGNGNVAVASVLFADGLHSLELAVVFLTLKGKNHLIHKVINVEEFQFYLRVVDLYRKAVGDVVAEGRHRRVVVGSAPLAEEVRKAVDKHFRTCLLGIIEEEFLPLLLAHPVRMSCIASDKRGLYRGGEHHRTGVAVFAEGVEQGGGEAEVTLAEIVGILRTVDSGEVEHEVGLSAIAVKLLRGRVDVILEHLIDPDGIVACLPLPYVVELGA